ncbi:hypothetical protein SLS59_006126 [Nothophoma quercina]|uniref:YeeE/YedE family protein n=1 Tax=Nothophoma quercina TaxID=749835 RepID=A0ABR3R6S1_9PLEO
MAHPAKVTSFLSFPVMHAWDPSLLLVILFGVFPNFLTIQWKGFTQPPAFAKKFELPTKTIKDVDAKFVAGAAAFGVGWGLTGTCPGPAVLRAFAQPVWGALWLDDVGSYFERATESESLYPPKCCGQIFLLDTYEAHIPFEVQWAFQMKEQGEYSVLAK